MKSGIIISPSGNFYGSEQVLYDYVIKTKKNLHLIVPKKSSFYYKLGSVSKKHFIETFKLNAVVQLYFKIFYLLLTKRIKTIYINEAGHCKYILILAKVFKKANFLIHVRIIEDTLKNRWIIKPTKNVTVLSISTYIQNNLPYESVLIYDPFISKNLTLLSNRIETDRLHIGIIGRITLTKGFLRLINLLELIKEKKLDNIYQFKLYGDYVDDITLENRKKIESFSNVQLMGFVNEANEMYNSIDVVMHLSTQEALGRIMLEAIDFNKPFVGLDAAGIGEIALLLNLTDFVIDKNSTENSEVVLNKVIAINKNYELFQQKIKAVKPLMLEKFSLSNYVQKVDEYLSPI